MSFQYLLVFKILHKTHKSFGKGSFRNNPHDNLFICIIPGCFHIPTADEEIQAQQYQVNYLSRSNSITFQSTRWWESRGHNCNSSTSIVQILNNGQFQIPSRSHWTQNCEEMYIMNSTNQWELAWGHQCMVLTNTLLSIIYSSVANYNQWAKQNKHLLCK